MKRCVCQTIVWFSVIWRLDTLQSGINMQGKKRAFCSSSGEQYERKRHNSAEAGMMRVLTRRLNDAEEENSELKKQIMRLKHQLGREEAFQEFVDSSVELFGMLNQIKDDLKSIKISLRSIESRQ